MLETELGLPSIARSRSVSPGSRSAEGSLANGFLHSADRFPDRPALIVDKRTYTYRELGERVAALAATIAAADRSSEPLVAILAHRSATAYAGVLGALTSGRGYVPLNPKFPADRLYRTLELAGTRLLIAGQEAAEQLESLLSSTRRPLTVFLPDVDDPGEMRARHPLHEFVGAASFVADAALPRQLTVPGDWIAYLLFTSGSTGTPKGVPVTHANARVYARTICERFNLTEEDRVSQMSDLTFDWSIQDLFPCWEGGACLVSVPEAAVFAPARLIRDYALTVWACVPSVVLFMQKMHALKPNAFPSIRYSVFCGEALTVAQAEAWQRACPNSIVENFYGPTETTVAVTAYRWDAERSAAECPNGIVPIGRAFDGQRVVVVGDDRRQVAPGVIGELCIGGSQVTPGYWNDPEKTADRFVKLEVAGPDRWYSTGDLGWEDEAGCLYFAGRIDDQVKIRGYRVELAEIDHVVQRVTKAEHVVSVAWPTKLGNAEGVVTFVCGAATPSETVVIVECRSKLPDYMVPRRLLFVDSLPLNTNGKVDRRRLLEQLEQEEA